MPRCLLYLLLIQILSGTICTTQKGSPAESEIHKLVMEDQDDRIQNRPNESANDTVRRKRAHQLLDEGALRAARDFSDAAIIFQHGTQPDDYLLAHILAMIAVAKGDKNGREIAAVTLDRYLQSIGQSQIFGTQYLDRGYSEQLQAKNCQQRNVGKKAARADQTNAQKSNKIVQEPYNSSLISDSVRKLYCVAGMDQQKKNLESLNAGKEMPEQPKSPCAE
jgi:hypothetical protein